MINVGPSEDGLLVMNHPVDLKSLRAMNPIPNRRWTIPSAGIGVALYKLVPGAQVIVENPEALPQRPAIIAMNHTHFYDWMPLRAPLLFKGQEFISWVKARAYKDAFVSEFLQHVGCIPVCSRGYVIACDFFDVQKRPPTEDEYRALRDHIDKDTELPEGRVFDSIRTTRRDILGRPFDPDAESWASAVRQTYYELMMITIDKTKRNVERGDHVHIYPQGSIAKNLIPGKIGIIQAALALDLPIIAAGMSGCRESYAHNFPVPMPGQKVTIRFSDTPYVIPRDEFPPNYRPFHPEDEKAHRDKLQRHVDVLMEQLNALLEPEYQWAEDMQSDAKTGVMRFF